MGGEQGRILIVDDEETVRNLLQRILAEVGYDVVTAANGMEALEKVYQSESQVVLLDIKMPGMTGMEVLGKLSADSPDVCVIMITAVLDTQTAVEAMKLGAYDYITKPFNRDDVVQKVQEAINKWHRQIQEKRQFFKLKESVREQTQRMQEQFGELVASLAREHRLLHDLSAGQARGDKSPFSELPPELQKPMSSVEEFRDALLRILGRG